MYPKITDPTEILSRMSSRETSTLLQVYRGQVEVYGLSDTKLRNVPFNQDKTLYEVLFRGKYYKFTPSIYVDDYAMSWLFERGLVKIVEDKQEVQLTSLGNEIVPAILVAAELERS